MPKETLLPTWALAIRSPVIYLLNRSKENYDPDMRPVEDR